MKGDADVAAAAATLAAPARAALVLALMEDVELAAGELAARAGVSPSTASGHLARLVDAGFLTATSNGRQRRYRLADPGVAEAVEALARVAPERAIRSLRESTTAELIRRARTCYDHLAGRLGVAVAGALIREQALTSTDGSLAIGPAGDEWFASIGIELEGLRRERRQLVRTCVDWSEREPHLAGALGAALTHRLFELGWIARHSGSRAVAVTPEGRQHLAALLGLTADSF